MTTNALVKATYTKDNGEVSERVLVIMSKPVTNVMALDVTALNEEKQNELNQFVAAQKEALNLKLKELGASWKSFKPEGLNIAA